MKARAKEELAEDVERTLMRFHQTEFPLLGIQPIENRLAFVGQVIDSVQRIIYVETIRGMPHSANRADPGSELFDPLKAAVLLSRAGDFEEAAWLVFLATHCGKNRRTGWRLCAELYGSPETKWTWSDTSADIDGFRRWLEENHRRFTGQFGNHRKYESLKPGPKGTAAVVASYVAWAMNAGSQATAINVAVRQAAGDEKAAFARLYQDMRTVLRFGRTARFDFLTMLAKLGLAPIEADSTYMSASTGPVRGARLLFDGQIDSSSNARVLEAKIGRLDQALHLGMQVLEDSLCNWQKSPNNYRAFRG